MKKFTAGLLTGVMMISSTVAFGADGVITSISTDPDTQYITVSGKINSDNDRDRVTLRITKAGDIPEEDKVLCTYQVNTDENGEYIFGFSMPDGTDVAEYSAYIKAEDIEEQKQSFRYFGNVSSLLSSDINGASSVSALRSFLENDNNAGMEMFGIDTDIYEKINDDGKTFVVSAVFSIKQDLNGFSNGKQLRDAFDQALLVELIREDKETINDDNIKALTIDYSNKAGNGYETFATMFETVKKSDPAIEKAALSAIKESDVTDVESFWKAYNNSVTKKIISGTEYWTEVRDFINDNKDLIGQHATINWNSYDRNTQNACKALVRGNYSTLDSFASALKSAISNSGSSSSGGGGGGSSSGGGGGGGNYTGGNTGGAVNNGIPAGTVSTPISGMIGNNNNNNDNNIKPTADDEYSFEDLRRTPWANEAVSSLTQRNIINGYGDGTFRPERSITREEFVTIVIKAFYPNIEKMDCEFTDVAKDAWSYSYISAASNFGIIQGVGENKFAPTDNIKRQDVAVIISNILTQMGRSAGTDENQPFADESTISAYALESVKKLKAAGIVKGDDANNFNPLSETTRAEAAVIIYNVLSK